MCRFLKRVLSHPVVLYWVETIKADGLKGLFDSLLFRINLFGWIPVWAVIILGAILVYPKTLDYIHISKEQRLIDNYRGAFNLYLSLLEEQRQSVIWTMDDETVSENDAQDAVDRYLTLLNKQHDTLHLDDAWLSVEAEAESFLEPLLGPLERLDEIRIAIKTGEIDNLETIYESYNTLLKGVKEAFVGGMHRKGQYMENSRVSLEILLDTAQSLSKENLYRMTVKEGDINPLSLAAGEEIRADVYVSLLSKSLVEVDQFFFSTGAKDIRSYLEKEPFIGYDRVNIALDDLADFLWEQGQFSLLQAKDEIYKSIMKWVFGIAILVLGMAWFGFLIAGRLSLGMYRVIHALEDLKACKLQTRCDDLYGHDEFARLAGTFNNVSEHLEGVIISVRQTSKDLMEETQKVALNSSRMSVSCHEQVHKIDDIQSTVDDSSEAISKANEAARVATHMIQKMTRNLGDVTHSVQGLAESTDEIGFVTESIDEIAEKINLLALNAAIEAARAGDAGRGFAVVADEVRKLAQNAAKSNAQIKKAMEKMAVNVNSSVTQMTGVSTMLGDVEGKVQHLNQTMDGQMTAFGNMVETIEDFNKHMETLKSDVDATNGVAGTLSQYAYNMDYQVQVFSLTKDDEDDEEEISIAIEDDIDLF